MELCVEKRLLSFAFFNERVMFLSLYRRGVVLYSWR